MSGALRVSAWCFIKMRLQACPIGQLPAEAAPPESRRNSACPGAEDSGPDHQRSGGP